MEYLNIALRFLAASQGLLFLLLIVFSKNPARVRIVGTLLGLGIIMYLIMPMVASYTPYMPYVRFLWFLSAITPSLMLLFVWFIFEEQNKIPAWMIALVGCSVLGSLWFQFTKDGLPGSPWWLQTLKVIIAAMVILVVWRGRDNDLVELRAKARNFFVLGLALLTFIIIGVEVVTQFEPPLYLDTFSMLIIFSYTLTLNYFFTKLNPSAQLMPTAPPAATERSDDPLIKELLERMRAERLYADHDLRVGSLASMMNIPEYKLRKKINQQLGYRNFNQFVNHYRIEEAGVKLREDPRTPVLTIALDVGFRSISSFNSAFQSQFGVSPTKYRAETLPNF